MSGPYIRFDGRVALVTGAGGGLGRAYALLLAARGAMVVVNDVSAESATQVVEEICRTGGRAIANHDSVAEVSGGLAIVECAMAAFGRLDAVVANAGIMRLAAYEDETPEDFQTVVNVSLGGSYWVTRAALPIMRHQNYGRVVFTTSAAGTYGHTNRASYAAAKAGIAGLTRALAAETASVDIACNAIAPYAATPMTRDVMTDALAEDLDPTKVSPVVAYLASHACTLSGQIIAVGGGGVSRVITGIAEPWRAPAPGYFMPEDVRDNLPNLNTSRSHQPESIAEELALLRMP